MSARQFLRRQLVDFQMPAFKRISWVSHDARALWEPRLTAAADAIQTAEVEMIRTGRLKAAVHSMAAGEFADRARKYAQMGITTIPAQEVNVSSEYQISVVLANAKFAQHVAEAMSNDDLLKLCGYLGMRACCRNANSLAIDAGISDSLWLFYQSFESRGISPDINASADLYSNLLLRPLGIRLIPFVPCKNSCTYAASFARETLATIKLLGLDKEARDIEVLLSMSAYWSSLHGIAETKTPIFRFINNTDATSGRLSISLLGDEIPKHAHVGIRFPYVVPQGKRFTETAAYRRGLGQLRQVSG